MATERTRNKVPQLLNSGGRMALVGLLTSLTTLLFALWFQYTIRHQISLSQPLATNAVELEGVLERSFVELRGWVAYQDPAAKQARAEVWEAQIIPRLNKISETAEALDMKDVNEDVAKLQSLLRRLRYLQWSVEDIAHTPSNNLAQAAYQMEIRPLQESAEQALTTLNSSTRATPRSLRLRAAMLELSSTLRELLAQYTPAKEGQLLRQRKRIAALAEDIMAAPMSSRTDRSIRFAASELLAMLNRVEFIVALRKSDRWNTADHLYKTQLRPLRAEVQTLAEHIANHQVKLARGQGQSLFRWSFVVLGLSLLMGVFSAFSLYLSYQLEFRVERALAKAKSLGQYVLEEKIGSGGMGEVYRAKHALLRRPSAVKVMRTENMLNPKEQERFQKEVQMTSQLSHPNTIAIFDYGRTPEGMFYYAMELLDGVTLDAMVKLTGPLSPARVVHILTQICSSLSEAHTKGLLHRDIKPSNVMLAQLGGVYDRVKLLDFGLVTQLKGPAEKANTSDHIVGTPQYIAPETIRAEGAATPVADLYAVGAVAYFLLTGKPPFQYTRVEELLHAHLEELPVPPSEHTAQLPDDLEVIVLGCLAKDPGDRPQSAAALRAMLQQAQVPAWSEEDAQLWWEQYGEALRAEARAQELRVGITRSRIGARNATGSTTQ